MSKSKSRFANPLGRLDREGRVTSNAYHYYLDTPVISPRYVCKFMDSSSEEQMRMAMTTDPEVEDCHKALAWTKKHLKDVDVDYRDLRQIEDPSCVFSGLNNFLVRLSTLVIGGPLPEDKKRDLVSTCRMTSVLWWHVFGAWDHGGRIFNISRGLADKMFLTDIKGLTCNDVRLPFPSTVLRVPPSMISLEAAGTGWHQMDTVYVSEGHQDGSRVMSFFFVGRENENSQYRGDDASYYFNVMFKDEKWAVEDAINHVLQYGRGFTVDSTKTVMRDIRGREGDEAVVRALKFVVNLLVYINSTGDFERAPLPERWHKLKEKERTLTGKKKRNAHNKMLELEKDPRPYLVGRKINVEPKFSKAARAHGRGTSPSVASYVRGHWRQQAHGPGRTLRKPLWIQPHWRNLQEGGDTEREYEVK